MVAKRHTLNANTMATQRRFIMNNNKLTTTEHNKITQEVKQSAQRKPKITDNNDEPAAENITEYILNGLEKESLEEPKTKEADNHSPETQILLKSTEQGQEIESLKQEIKRKMEENENTDAEMSREPLKKINENENESDLSNMEMI